jgi:serine acetyltransferase
MNRFNRLIQWLHKSYKKQCSWAIVNLFQRIIIQIVTRFIRWYYHCDIPYSLDISGCYFCHKGFGVVINPRTIIGKNVVIQHSVTIGEIGDKTPIIGDNVYIGAKATIIGNVNIGNNVKIGAGSVVLKDVPDGCSAVGVPARIIRHKDE